MFSFILRALRLAPAIPQADNKDSNSSASSPISETEQKSSSSSPYTLNGVFLADDFAAIYIVPAGETFDQTKHGTNPVAKQERNSNHKTWQLGSVKFSTPINFGDTLYAVAMNITGPAGFLGSFQVVDNRQGRVISEFKTDGSWEIVRGNTPRDFRLGGLMEESFLELQKFPEVAWKRDAVCELQNDEKHGTWAYQPTISSEAKWLWYGDSTKTEKDERCGKDDNKSGSRCYLRFTITKPIPPHPCC